MPVSHKFKLIYIHIPKCAGSTVEYLINTDTIEEYFSQTPTEQSALVFNKKNFITEKDYHNCINKSPQHFTYRELQLTLPKNVFQTYKKITVVRHPFTRIISGFHFILKLKYASEKPRNSWLKINTFEDYVNWLHKSIDERVKEFNGHFETQTSYLVNNVNSIQDITIFKYENLEECFDYLKPITNFTYIPHIRKSHINKTWQDYKTPELQEKIYNFYKEDFLNFNYKCDI